MIIESGRIEHGMKCQNPFIVAMYHLDHFPSGNGTLGPSVRRPVRTGGDMDMQADWRMYYGQKVPGFPAHPHRGFETVTVVVRGTVDHTDGLGSKGRYENGDVQWMTAGSGLQHAEMFPLRRTDQENPLELFQIWLSLDQANRMTSPDYKMLWREEIPVIRQEDEKGNGLRITVIAGEVDGQRPPMPTQASWAARPEHHLSIQIIELDPGASYTIPAGPDLMNRSLYFYEGTQMTIIGEAFPERSYAFVTGSETTVLANTGTQTGKLLLLESLPIHEPIVAHGPFVMSSMEEIRQAYSDYQQTQFGGWPFESPEVYHSTDQERFAEYPDGRVEYPGMEQ